MLRWDIMSQQYGYFPQILVGPGATPPEKPASAGQSVAAPQPLPPGVVTLPGASLFEALNPPRLATWQRQTRRQGDASLYNPGLAPGKPYQFSLGAFEVPKSMGLFLTTWEVRIFTFSGVGASDTVEVDPGNLTTSLALDFLVGERRPFQADNEIVPQIIVSEDALTQRGSQSAAFYLSQSAQNKTSASGASKGLLPFDNRRPGSDVGPFSVFIQPQDGKFGVSCFVFEPLQLPVAFFQLRIAGYLTNQADAQRTLEKMIVPLPKIRALRSPSLSCATGPKPPGPSTA